MTEEKKANPYNARKEWHTPDEPNRGSADTLFFEEDSEEATRKAAPQKKKDSEEVNYKKRYDDLKKHYDDKVAEFKQREQELAAVAETQKPNYTPPKTKEDLEAFKKKYPDLFETVETVAHMRSQEEIEIVKQKLKFIEEREKDLQRKEAMSQLRERHPDFEDIKNDDKFHAWAKEQPEEIQTWIYKNPDNVNLASRAIDFYKMEKGLATKQPSRSATKNAQTNAADFVSTKTTTVDTKQPKVWTQREIAALSIDDYDRFEEEIDRAIVEGRVIK